MFVTLHKTHTQKSLTQTKLPHSFLRVQPRTFDCGFSTYRALDRPRIDSIGGLALENDRTMCLNKHGCVDHNLLVLVVTDGRTDGQTNLEEGSLYPPTVGVFGI